MKYAIINSASIVENIIVWDGASPYDPGNGLTLVVINDGVMCQIGWIYDPVTQTFTDPNPPAPPAEEPSPVEEPAP